MPNVFNRRTLSSVVLSALTLVPALALSPRALPAQWAASRVDAHAPVGVMGDHRHERGEVMLSLRVMPMEMEGSRIGARAVSNAEIVSPNGENFMVTPINMSMRMVMAGAMYAQSDRVTLMAMIPYLDDSMDHITRAGGAFTTTSSGIGDIELSALVGLGAWDTQLAHLNLGISLPTGSISAEDVLPTSNGTEVQLPYPMQLGSGTMDLKPGVTYLGQRERFSWGLQAIGTFRLGENDRGWTQGNRMDATGWFGYPVTRNVSLSARGALGSWGNVTGVDGAASVNPAVVPTARTDLRGGTRLDGGVGVNWYAYRPAGLRFSAEALLPIYQRLDGPQLEQRSTLVFGVQMVPVH